jgi:hypothetical protein
VEQINANHPFECTMITCHGWWPGSSDPFWQGNQTENRDRIEYYGVNGVPQLYIDGLIDAGYGGPWEQMMLSRAAVASPLTIDVTGQLDTDSTGTISALVTNTSGAPVSGNLHFVLIEDDSPYAGKTYNYVMRDFIPGGTEGEIINLGPGGALSRDAAFHIKQGAPPSGWVRGNMAAIVFVQNDATFEVYQTGRIFFELDEPELRNVAVTVDDTATGDGDGRLDPGETVAVSCTLGNLNPTTATGLTGTLSTTDGNLTVTDGAGSWPDIPQGQLQANAGDPFGVAASPTTPYGRVTTLTLDLTSNGRAYGKTLTIRLPVGSPEQPIGPDAYGYYAYENGDLAVPAPTFSWVEINPNLGGPGTLFTLGDDQTRSVTAPFTFRYYGQNFTTMSICSNGFVAMGTTTDYTNGNGEIPGTAGPPNMVAGFWTDLDPAAAGGGKVYTYNDAANHRYIVEFSGVEHYHSQGLGVPETFEYIFYDPAYYATPTGDGEIVLQYNLVSDASSCTVGIENANETIGIQYLAVSQLNAAAQGLQAGRAIKFTTRDPSGGAWVGDRVDGPRTAMLMARPNPLRGGTQIAYELPTSGDAALRIFSVEGAVVRTLFRGRMPAGPGTVSWDGRDDRGRAIPAGVYFYRLNGDGFEVNRKLVKQQ